MQGEGGLQKMPFSPREREAEQEVTGVPLPTSPALLCPRTCPQRSLRIWHTGTPTVMGLPRRAPAGFPEAQALDWGTVDAPESRGPGL